MMIVKLAEHCFRIEPKYSHVEYCYKNYIVPENEVPKDSDIPLISVTEEEIERENVDKGAFSKDYLETLAVYRKICESLIEENILLFHSSALALDGKGYLFTGKSGTGKSTHARLWRTHFGNRITTVNDDKPLLYFKEDGIYVYGTPYGGKDGLQNNVNVKVHGIVLLKQAKENKARVLSDMEAFVPLYSQTYKTGDPFQIQKIVSLLNRMMKEIPVIELGCTISDEAVLKCHEALTEAEKSYSV